ncbi:MAG: phosphate signaling complex protein PhoU [Gammaproteobacteria bacterium]|nr:phosphate signaling complex protein PhoU [Gammaproteobacteria bacterium]
MSVKEESKPLGRHILSRFDGDLGHMRSIVLEMGERVADQVSLAGDALSDCDVGKARKVIHDHRRIRDLDIDALQANAALYAVHQPVASDLRYVLTLSRAVYDLERIAGEAVRLADIAEGLYEFQPTLRECRILEDVRRMSRLGNDMLQRAMRALADEDVAAAVNVALDGSEIDAQFKSALRRLATYLMEDPRNIRWVIEATLGIKAMERVADHACSIARNIIYSVTGKDVRHANLNILETA